MNQKKRSRKAQGKGTPLAEKAAGEDTRFLTKRLEEIQQTSDPAGMETSLKQLLARWPEMKKKVKTGRRISRKLPKIVTKSFIGRLAGK